MTLQAIHDFELALVDPCMAILERGLKIDDLKRKGMIVALEQSIAPKKEHVQEIALKLLQGAKKVPKIDLFKQTWTCSCCRAGKAKMRECWSCAGLSKKPGKRVLEALPEPLGPCRECDGQGRYEKWVFNPASHEQVKVILYTLLRLPKRTKDGKLTSDEDALKDLRAHDESGFVEALLEITKATTIVKILQRMAPADDGRLRTWLNVAGTETGRFSSSETFLEVSTNLQNLPKKVAAQDPRYDVRDCVVPDDGEVLLEADLSQAEARVVAALCGDAELLAKWDTEGFDVHRWTASIALNKPEDEVTKVERNVIGKTARHATSYQEGPMQFMKDVNSMTDFTGYSITSGQAKMALARLLKANRRLQSWWDHVEAQLNKSGMLETCFGRRRTFFQRPGHERLKEAIAFEPQSTVADLLNRGMLRWWQNYDGKIGRLIGQVHDSVLLSVPKERAKVAAKLLKKCLEEEIVVNGIPLTIPADVSTSAESWARMEAI